MHRLSPDNQYRPIIIQFVDNWYRPIVNLHNWCWQRPIIRRLSPDLYCFNALKCNTSCIQTAMNSVRTGNQWLYTMLYGHSAFHVARRWKVGSLLPQHFFFPAPNIDTFSVLKYTEPSIQRCIWELGYNPRYIRMSALTKCIMKYHLLLSFKWRSNN